ncbi:hypothetical protein pb186bvf_014955 [Paramecium bursaria]
MKGSSFFRLQSKHNKCQQQQQAKSQKHLIIQSWQLKPHTTIYRYLSTQLMDIREKMMSLYILLANHQQRSSICKFSQTTMQSHQHKTFQYKSEIKLNNYQIMSDYMGPLAFQPVRTERPSLLSTDSDHQNYRGFINLAFMILIANHIRLILENFIKYGVLFNNMFSIQLGPSNTGQTLSAILYLAFSILIGYGLQILQFKLNINTGIIKLLNTINIGLTFVIPAYLIQGNHPSANLILLAIQCVYVMKLISYAHFMRHVKLNLIRLRLSKDYKISEQEADAQTVTILKKYLNNFDYFLDFKHYLYFLAAPTLCFQLTYPRSKSVRKLWVLKRVIEYLLVSAFQVIIWYQYVEPLLNNTYEIVRDDPRYVRLFERLLKLSLPNTYLWIAMFFGGFQCALNITAELLRYADRQFYKDWWNCKNLEEYWKLWNIPVHHWLVRHIYLPCLKSGLSKSTANMIVFFISALGHEYIVSASLGIIEYWAFIGMIMQAPVIQIQKKIEKIFKLQNSQLGNLMFWCSFCIIGQPILIFVYYFRFLEKLNK